MTLEKVNLAHKLALFSEHWSPHIVGEVQEMHIKLVKFQGEFVWHQHEQEDEMFYVVAGRFCMRLRTGDIWLEAGEFLVVPRGIEHCPYAPEEVQVMLIELASTLNTGDTQDARTKTELKRI